MKKITLALFAAVCSVGAAYGQVVIEAPQYNNAISQFRAPNGTSLHAVQQSVMFIHENEMLPLNMGTINSFSFQYTGGTGSIPVSGQFTVMMQNSPDVFYNKGASFAAAVAPMNVVYIGNYTVPPAAGAVTVGVNLTSPFPYTGKGLYMAWKWESSGPFSVGEATLRCNNDQNWIGTSDGTVAPAPDALGGAFWRPAILFNAVNTASNELEVIEIEADGKSAKLNNTAQDVYATVLNTSSTTVNQITVGLAVAAPNTFAQQVVIPSMGAMTALTVTFTGFNPQTNGLAQMSVAIINPDQDPTNNLRVWTQSVTCNEMGGNPPTPTFKSSFGANVAGIFAYPHMAPVASTLTGIRFAVGNTTTNIGKTVFGTLLDDQGNILANSTTDLTITSGMLGTFVSMAMPKVSLSAGTDYFFGVSQPANQYFPMAILDYTLQNVVPPFKYFFIPINGGAPSAITNADGFLGIEAQLIYPQTSLVVSTPTGVCKGSTVTISATGSPTSYTWTGVGTAGVNTPTAVVTPTIAGATGTGNVTYSAYGIDPASGCRTETGSSVIAIKVCTTTPSSIVDNQSAGGVKIYPNPTVAGKAFVSGLQGANTITVFNALGQAVVMLKSTDDTATIDLSNVAPGTYIVKITGDNSESRLMKIVNQ